MAFISTSALFRATAVPFEDADPMAVLTKGVRFLFHVELNEGFIRDNSALEPMDVWLDICAMRNSWMLTIMGSFVNEGARLLSGMSEFDDELFWTPEILRTIDCFYAGDFTAIEFCFEIKTDFESAMVKELKYGFDFGHGLQHAPIIDQTQWIKKV